MQNQITTPVISLYYPPQPRYYKKKSAACFTHHNSVNIKKGSFGAGDRTHDPALQKFFIHHYTIRLFVNIFAIAVFLYNEQ